MKQTTLVPSRTPLDDLYEMAFPGQSPKSRMYKTGFESFMELMPKLEDSDPFLKQKISFATDIMLGLSDQLQVEGWVRNQNPPKPGEFDRTILAIEQVESNQAFVPVEPEDLPQRIEGAEMLVARWGDGFSSPVHGHAPGLLFEKLLYGRMLVNYYQMTEQSSNIVRPLFTKLFVGESQIVSDYARNDSRNYFKRQATIHNFTSVGNSASLHYVAEHVRDGRDNQFEVQHFEDYYSLDLTKTERLTSNQAHYSRIGDVILVRSSNVPEYGVHFIVVTGHPVMKPHGLRIQDEVIMASPNNRIMDTFGPEQDLVLLKLDQSATYAFLKFHNIEIVNKQVVFPDYK